MYIYIPPEYIYLIKIVVVDREILLQCRIRTMTHFSAYSCALRVVRDEPELFVQ